MNNHLFALNRNNIKQMVLDRFRYQKADSVDKFKKMMGAGATGIDEVLLNLPSKNSRVKNIIEKYAKENPTKSKVARGIGFVGGAILPGMSAVKVLSKFGKAGKILKSKTLGGTIGQAAVYGGASPLAEGMLKGGDDTAVKTLVGTIEGAATGAILGNLGRAVKGVKKMMSPTSRISENRKTVEKMQSKLLNELGPAELRLAKKAVSDAIPSKYLKVNNLLYRGNEKTKSIIDALAQRSPKVRDMIEIQNNALSKSHMPYVEEAIIKAGDTGARPDTKSYLENLAKYTKDKKEALYEQAKFTVPVGTKGIVSKVDFEKVKIPRKITLSKRLMSEPLLLEQLKKAMKNINALDKGKGINKFDTSSVAVLHNAKRYLGDKVESLMRQGMKSEARDAQLVKEALRDAINKQVPKYKEATELAKKQFAAEEAAAAGREFKGKISGTETKITPEMLKEQFKKLSQIEQQAYKQGALQSLLERGEQRAENSLLPNIAKDIENPRIQEYLRAIMPEKKVSQLVKSVGVSSEGLKTLNEISKGSKTAKHLSNKNLAITAFTAGRGNIKARIRLIDKAIGKLSGINQEKAAKSQMNLLMNPERLLKLASKKEKPNKAISPKLTALLVNARNKIDEE